MIGSTLAASVSLFVTRSDAPVRHETEPSFVLAVWSLAGNRWAQLVIHGEPEGTFPQLIASSVNPAKSKAREHGFNVPADTYGYFLGPHETGVRYLYGAKVR